MSQFCRSHGIAFHMDGARLWEALSYYTSTHTVNADGSEAAPPTVQEVCALFDSIYISCYKGLGGITGALLIGNADFIVQSRVWLRRYGGNVYSLMPYAVSAYACYRNYVLWNDNTSDVGAAITSTMDATAPYSMKARRLRMKHVVALLTRELASFTGNVFAWELQCMFILTLNRHSKFSLTNYYFCY